MTTEFDIESFDSVSECEKGTEMELMHDDGITSVGIFLSVLGDQADTVAKHDREASKKLISGRNIAEKQKKEADFTNKLIDTVKTRDIESAIVRITGWRNVKQAYTPDLMRKALDRNPHWVAQVHKFSGNIANFTVKPVQS